MKKIYLILILAFNALVQMTYGQCNTTPAGRVMAGTPTFTYAGTQLVGNSWGHATILPTGFKYVILKDTDYVTGSGSIDNIYYEIYTCGRKNVQIWVENFNYGTLPTTNYKYDLNNYSCGGSDSNEYVMHVGVVEGVKVYFLGDSASSISDTVTVYYRRLCKSPDLQFSWGNKEWIGNVWKWTSSSNYFKENLGTTANQNMNFTMNLDSAAPTLTNACQICPSRISKDSFALSFRMDTIFPRKFYKIVCNTPGDLKLTNGTNTALLDYWTNGSSVNTKQTTRLFIPTTTTDQPSDLYKVPESGHWRLDLKKSTGTLKADFSICQMDGDYTWGIDKWNAYVYDWNNPSYYGNVYQGTFSSDSSTFAYDWGTAQPTINNSTCGVTMDDSSYFTTFLMKKNFQQGRYKIRIRSKQGGNCSLTDRTGVIKYLVSNVAVASTYDITSPYITFSGDTFLSLTVYKYNNGTSRLSFVSCREPKDPGHITVSRDTACVGDQVTLTADTADGTETQWYKKSCAGAGGLYIGSGASITVTMDTSTTFYVRNRNRAYASGDTTNSLDLYSTNCSSKRIIAVPYPSAPTAPTAQSRCSSGSEIFTFSGVNAGTNGNQVQWATSSGFTNCKTITSGGSFNDTVANGLIDTIWLRSKRSDGGCVSSAVVTTAANHTIPGLPIAPTPQRVCSDTGCTFIFDSIQVGNGADSLEWALNNNFTGSTVIHNNSFIALSVAPDVTDTVWIRAKSADGGCTSQYVNTFASVKKFPNASITPVDTFLLPGDSIFLTATGGGSYYWPQLQSSDQQVKVLYPGGNVEYFVGVSDLATGCGKLARSNAQQLINHSDFTISYSSGNNDVVACHDIITMAIASVYTTNAPFQIAIDFPNGITPAFDGNFNVTMQNSTVFSPVNIPNTSQMGFGTTNDYMIFSWVTSTNALIFNVPAHFQGVSFTQNFTINVPLFIDCNTIPGTVTPSVNIIQNGAFALQPPSIQVVIPEISVTPIQTSTNATSNQQVTQNLSFCLTANSAPVYDLVFAPQIAPGSTANITLTYNSLPVPPLTFSGVTASSGPFNLDLMQDFGINSISSGCIQVSSVLTPVVAWECGAITPQSYSMSVDCYSEGVTCGTVTAHRDVSVQDFDFGLEVQRMLLASNGSNATPVGVSMCDDFGLKYTIVNLPGLGNNLYNKKIHKFSLDFDPNWIDLSGIASPTITQAGVPVTWGSFVITPGNITFNFDPGTTFETGLANSIVIIISGLHVTEANGLVGPNCTTGSIIIGEPKVEYTTPCGADVEFYNPGSHAVSYANMSSPIIPNAFATLNGQNNSQVAPNDDPVLHFNWQQFQQFGSPLAFVSQNTSGVATPLFKCISTTYFATLSLDPQIQPQTLTDGLSFDDGTGPDPKDLVVLGSGWQSTLSTPGSSNQIEIPVTIGNCPTSFTGGLIYPSLRISAQCNNSSCVKESCFLEMENTLSVHCAGACDNTGIGTDAFIITNQTNTNQLDLAAYACDDVKFHIEGTGYYTNGAFPPGNTDEILAELTYPALLGSTVDFFDFSNSSATYNCQALGLSGNLVVSGPSYNSVSNSWSVILKIHNQAHCQAIRAGQSFSLDFQLPVDCDLPYNFPGVYNLNGINAILSFTNIGTSGSISCDAKTGGFTLFAHQYLPSEITFENGSNGTDPCNKVLTLKDAAIGGFDVDPEMPNNTRPILQWATDGSIYVEYFDADLNITEITYTDNSGYGPVLMSNNGLNVNHVVNGLVKRTEIRGVTALNGWPAYTKGTPEFMRQLEIEFSLAGCTAQDVVVKLKHQLAPNSCPFSCVDEEEIVQTLQVPAVTGTIELNTADQTVFNPLLTTEDIQINYTLINTGNVPANQISFNAVTGTGLNVNLTPTGNQVSAQLTNIENACETQIVDINTSYACSLQSNITCAASTESVNIVIKDPSIYINTLSVLPDNQFTTVKGICYPCDRKTLTFEIWVHPAHGPMYDPTLLINNNGPGGLNIESVTLQYLSVTGAPIGAWSTPSANGPSSAKTFTLGNVFNLHSSGTRYYMLPNEKVIVTVTLFGDGGSCDLYSKLRSRLNFYNVCNAPMAEVDNDYTFVFGSSNACSQSGCTSTYPFSNPVTTCLPCDFGATISIQAIVTNPSCTLGSTNGSIVPVISGGIPFYNQTTQTFTNPVFSYAWSTGAQTANIFNLSPGTYTLTVTSQQCEAIKTFVLTNSNLTISAAVTNPSCNGGANGQIALTVTGGTPPYTYAWSGGLPNSATVSNLSPGNYTVLVTSSNSTSCSPAVSSANLVNPPAIQVLFNVDDIGCANGQGTITAVTSGNYSYNWGDGLGSNPNFFTHNVSASGTYIVTITDLSTTASCTVSQSVIVGQNSNGPQTSSIGSLGIPNVCYGNTAYLSINGLVGFAGQTCDIEYTITSSSGSSSGVLTANFNANTGNSSTPIALGVYSADTYTFEITAIYLNNTPTCSLEITAPIITNFEVFPSETVTITKNIALCNGIPITLTAAAGSPGNYYTYFWSNSVTTHVGQQWGSITTDDTYIVTLTNTSTLCTATASFNVIGGDLTGANITVSAPYVCSPNTNPVILTASPAGYAYSWSGSASGSTQQVTTYTAGNFSVTISDQVSGCTSNVSVTLDQNNLTAGIDILPGPQCGINTVNLQAKPYNSSSGSPTYTYLWSNGQTTSAISPSVITGTNSFTVTVTDLYGCTASASATIDVNPQPNASITFDNNNGAPCSSLDQVLIANPPGYSYSWNTSATTQSIYPVTTGTYTVTVDAGNGCSSTASTSIASLAISPNAVYVGDGVNSSTCIGCSNASGGIPDITAANQASAPNHLPTIAQSGGQIVVVGTFNIDLNYSFDNGVEIVMQPDAKIVVQPGITANFFNGWIHSCSHQMWETMQVLPLASLNLRNTKVWEGKYAVTVDPNSSITIRSCEFQDNYIGVHTSKTNPAFSSFGQFRVVSSTFKGSGTNTLYSPFAGEKPFVGIELNNIVFASVGDPSNNQLLKNLFATMRYGILGYESDFSVYNCQFDNISYPQSTDGGAGIYVTSKSKKAFHTLFQQGYGGDYSSTFSFNHCTNGIYATRYNLVVEKNHMTDVKVGVASQFARFGTQLISDNAIECGRTGVWMYQNSPVWGVDILRNKIKVSDSHYHKGVGIRVNETLSPNQYNYDISNNEINVIDAVKGIDLNGLRQADILGNVINCENETFNQYGIGIVKSDKCDLTGNTVIGSGTWTSAHQNIGILARSTTNSIFSCNSVDDITTGMKFELICDDADIKGNDLNNHSVGLHYGAFTKTYKQKNKGNKWNAVLNIDALNDAGQTYVLQSQYLVNSPSQFIPTNVFSSAQWFVTTSTPNYSCPEVNNNEGGESKRLSGDSISEGDYYTASFNLDSMQYAEELKYMSERYLLKKLYENQELLSGDSVLQNFYDSTQLNTIGEFYAIERLQDELIPDSVEGTYYINYRLLADSFVHRMVYEDSLLINGLLSRQDSIDVTADFLRHLSEYANLMDDYTYFEDVTDSLYSQKAQVLLDRNAALTAANTYEGNEKFLRGLYTQNLIQDTVLFNSDAIEDLYFVANQCPILGGDVVFWARSLYAGIDPDAEFADDELCNVTSPRMAAPSHGAQTETYKDVILYPNPTTGRVTIMLTGVFDVLDIVLQDIMGQSHYRDKIAANTKLFTFEVANLATGTYILTCRSKGDTVAMVKLVIMR